jgi:hypothetical protein
MSCSWIYIIQGEGLVRIIDGSLIERKMDEVSCISEPRQLLNPLTVFTMVYEIALNDVHEEGSFLSGILTFISLW